MKQSNKELMERFNEEGGRLELYSSGYQDITIMNTETLSYSLEDYYPSYINRVTVLDFIHGEPEFFGDDLEELLKEAVHFICTSYRNEEKGEEK